MRDPRRSGDRPRAAIYARVSTKEQEEGYSIAAQLELLRTYCATNGIEVVSEFVEAETAKEAGRRMFGEMLDLARRGGIAAIVVEKTDRLYRNLKDRVSVDELDLAIHLVKEGEVISRDSRSHAKFVHDIKLVLSKNYIDNLSEETRKGMLQKARQGIHPTKAPLGYSNVSRDGRRIVEADPERAELVRALFLEAAKGRRSLRDLTAFAFETGLRSKKGNRLSKSAVFHILTNPVYTGVVVWRGETHVGTHPALADRATFERVRKILSGRNRNNAGSGVKSFAYRGLLVCAHCGCALTAETKKGRYVYYHCTGNRGPCPKPFVREGALTEEIARIVRSVAVPRSVIGTVLEEIERTRAEDRERARAETARLAATEERLAKRLERLYLDFAEGTLGEETYSSLRNRTSEELREVRNLRGKPVDQGLDSGRAELLELAAEGLSRFESGAPDAKREVVDALCSNSTYGLDGVQVSLREPFLIVAQINANRTEINPETVQLEEWLPELDSNQHKLIQSQLSCH